MLPKKKTKRAKTGKVTRLDKRLTEALNHPLRTEILAILSDTCASPSEMADMLGEELSNVSYHTKRLFELECIEVVDKQQVRGAVKTRYRATMRMLLNGEDWDRLSLPIRSGISANALNEIGRRARASVEAGVFDKRKDRSILTVKMDVDEQGWKDANKAAWECYERMADIEAEVVARKAKGAKTFRMTSSQLVFESPMQEYPRLPVGD